MTYDGYVDQHVIADLRYEAAHPLELSRLASRVGLSAEDVTATLAAFIDHLERTY